MFMVLRGLTLTLLLTSVFFYKPGRAQVWDDGLDYEFHPRYVELFENGESTGGLKMVIHGQDFIDGTFFAALCSSHRARLESDPGKRANLPVHDRVYNGRGELITRFDQLQDNDRLYLVLPKRHFVWPFVEQGHTVELPTDFLVGRRMENGKLMTDRPVRLISLNEEPRVFRLQYFFTDVEAEALVERALSITEEDSKLQRSTVGVANGKDRRLAHDRTSENAFDQTSPMAVALKQRVFKVLRIEPYNEDFADGLQVVNYQPTQGYAPHHDYFPVGTDPPFNFDSGNRGTNRFATVFMYLSDVISGGSTVFPEAPRVGGPEPIPEEAELMFDQSQWEYQTTKDCYQRLASQPRKGEAVLFYSQKPSGQLDPKSRHGACPVLRGVKWGANLWVWNKKRHGTAGYYGNDDDEADGDVPPQRANEEGTDVFVTFENVGPDPVRVKWETTDFGVIKPGKFLRFNSFVGHTWTILPEHSDTPILVRKLQRSDHETRIMVPTPKTEL